MMYAGEGKSLKGDMHAVPRVSVLMPLYNGKAFIEESLRSVQAQTFTDWEFIIVNDCGSDDGCADIVRAYAARDPRIRLIQCTERLGIAASLNKGLDAAVGEYVARVDVDDPSAPERLEKQVAFMDAHPELVLCSSWQRSVTPDRSYVQKVAAEREELKAAMLFGCEISHCGVMLRRETFLKNGWRYDPNYYGEDYELWLRVLAAGGAMENIPEPLVSHRWGFGNISLQKGEKLRREVCTLSARAVRAVGVDTSRYPIQLFAGWRNQPTEYARRHREEFLRQGAAFLAELIEKNDAVQLYDPAALRKVVRQRWSWVRQSCGLPAEQPADDTAPPVENGPLVSVVLPTFNSVEVISSAIDSVLAQTYTNWELLVINDDGSDDGTAEIVQLYGLLDSRIHLIQAESRLGLAESLNHGIRCAQGKYIARLDADDTSHPTRFAKQVALMESQPDVGICGTWQHHYGPNRDWVHRATADEQLLRCRLIFWCDLCHSTLMLRRSTFMEYELFFDNTHFAEDYELWTRAMFVTRIVNIPEVLGEYYEGTSNITAGKMDDLIEESGQLSSAVLNRALGMTLSYEDGRLLRSWRNPFQNAPDRREKLDQLKALLRRVWEANQDKQAFDDTALLQVIAAKWHWAADGMDWKYTDYRVSTIDDALSAQTRPGLWARYGAFRRNNPSAAVRAKKIIKRLLRPLINLHRKVLRKSFAWIIDELKSSVEHWTWNRYKLTERCFQKLEQQITPAPVMSAEPVQSHYTPYTPGEKIRIMFLFQAASFWPSWDSFYAACMADDRFDVTFAYLKGMGDTTQMKTAETFLQENHIPYVPYSDWLLLEKRPHVLIMQTPYDVYHRTEDVYTRSFQRMGCRVVYVPYGIEIADTADAHKDHFLRAALHCWRIYTFSEMMVLDYRRYCPNGAAARSVGHPKFDGLCHPERFPLPAHVVQQQAGRPSILWHVHFPKYIPQPNGREYLSTPYMEEYVQFAQYAAQRPECFFIFQPHPKFLDCTGDLKANARRVLNTLRSLENVYIAWEDDYRPFLLHADCIITDRSALMVESGAVGVPVLYMSNADYQEPVTRAIQPLIDSYAHGTGARDMIDFVEQFLCGEDPRKTQREDAFRLCIPHFDGQCGRRIADDIADSIYAEIPEYGDRLARMETEMRQMNDRLNDLLREYTK